MFLDNGDDQFTRQYFELETTMYCELINDHPNRFTVQINDNQYTVPDAHLDGAPWVYQSRPYDLNYEDEGPGDEIRREYWPIKENDFLDLIECFNPPGWKLRTRADFSTVYTTRNKPSLTTIKEVIAACKKERS